MTEHSDGMTKRGTAGADEAAPHAVLADRDLGGDPACWLNRVCDACGRFVEDLLAETCPTCGAPREP
jgi:rubrerythrin